MVIHLNGRTWRFALLLSHTAKNCLFKTVVCSGRLYRIQQVPATVNIVLYYLYIIYCSARILFYAIRFYLNLKTKQKTLLRFLFQARSVHRETGIPVRTGAAGGSGQGRRLEDGVGWRGENYYARHHALELASVSRVFPDSKLLSGHHRRHAVQRDRMYRIFLGTHG